MPEKPNSRPNSWTRKMSFTRALRVLINAASRDVKGQGLGYRSTTDAERNEVKAAIEVVYEKAYGFPLDNSSRFNLGI